MTEENGPKEDTGTTEKIWDATRKSLHVAAFKATRMKRIVQKRIDLAAIHKKISTAHTDLGKLVDDDREAGEKNILEKVEIKAIFDRLDQLKRDAAALEEEIESIKAEEPAEAEKASKAPPTNSGEENR